MTYCPVDMDIRNHAHNEGILADKEAYWDEKSQEILNDFLFSGSSEIDDDFIKYFDEIGAIGEVITAMAHMEMGRKEKAFEVLEKMMSDLRDVAGDFAENAAEDYIK